VFLAKYDPEADSLAIQVYQKVLERRSYRRDEFLVSHLFFEERILQIVKQEKINQRPNRRVQDFLFNDLILDST
jgi:hypothetical protein